MNNKFVLSGANIVILARNYNPSIVSKEWLLEKRIITKAVTNFIHTPVLSIIETDLFSLLLDQNRLQISLKNANTKNVDGLAKIAGYFISALPETPYVALGFNYTFSLPKDNNRLYKLMSPDDDKLKELFSEDYKIGLVASFTFKGFVTMINISPMQEGSKNTEISINFHSDSSNIEKIKEKLLLSRETMAKADAILRGLLK